MKHANPANPSQAIIKKALTDVCKLTLGISLSRLVFKMVNCVVRKRGGSQLLSGCWCACRQPCSTNKDHNRAVFVRCHFGNKRGDVGVAQW
jgi:hypothetical protein